MENSSWLHFLAEHIKKWPHNFVLLGHCPVRHIANNTSSTAICHLQFLSVNRKEPYNKLLHFPPTFRRMKRRIPQCRRREGTDGKQFHASQELVNVITCTAPDLRGSCLFPCQWDNLVFELGESRGKPQSLSAHCVSRKLFARIRCSPGNI